MKPNWTKKYDDDGHVYWEGVFKTGYTTTIYRGGGDCGQYITQHDTRFNTLHEAQADCVRYHRS